MRILTRFWVHVVVVALAVMLAFGPGLEGDPVWDDPATIGTAGRLESPLDAFSTELMSAGGSGATYVRPGVTLSLWLDLRVFSAAPTVGMHVTNLLWHVLAAVLVLAALRRWTRAADDRTRVACLVGTILWAVLPLKAENVAWISGRGDAMGLSFLLGAMALGARTGLRKRVAILVAGTMLALLCKETFVVAPILVAIELHAERGDGAAPPRRPPVEVLASVAVALGYLLLRGLAHPIAGGGAGMYAGLGLLDRASLVAETVGYAFSSLFQPWHAELLSGPVAFVSPTELVREPGMAVVGVLGTAAVGLLVARARVLRPSAALLLTFLPVANLIPTGLESRMSDRFLYLPSLSLALLAALLCASALRSGLRPVGPNPRNQLGAALVIAIACGSVALLVQARERSRLFTSNDKLFSWERQHGDRAASVLENAGTAAFVAGRYREARDLRLATVDRYKELGFEGEGFAEIVDALRYQVLATGEEHPRSMGALFELLTALDEGADRVVDVPFDDGRLLGLPTGTATARAYAAERAAANRSVVAWLRAKVGDAGALDQAREAVDACPRCPGVLRTSAEVALMSLTPSLAAEWLARAHQYGGDVQALTPATELALALVGSGDPGSLVAARFLGGGFILACREGAKLELHADPLKAVVLVSCSLAADGPRLAALGGWSTTELAQLAPTLRNDWAGRGALVMAAYSRE